ncbi:MAG TPA: phosphatidate cytidylyltransferase [Tepidisphaeraceae bacterium]|nr:phosphatidate cytidylyltransferase [Tepidisphaeraceae bacterium]
MERALKNRLIFGSIMLTVVLVLLGADEYLQLATRGWIVRGQRMTDGIGGIGLTVLLLAALPPAVVELATLFAAERIKPYRLISTVGVWALIIHGFLTQFRGFENISTSVLAFILVFTMLLAALRRAWRRQTQEAITAMAGTVLAMLYLGGLAWFFVALRVKSGPGFHGSTMAIVMIVLTVKFTDIGAFFGGKAIGKHKLIPWLSPQKTWEGLACGLVAAGLMGAVCAPSILGLTWGRAIIFGLFMGAIGQIGDLLESLMKRDAEVKDSGSAIPGFGGILDVLDSPLLAAPFAYLLFSLFSSR